MADKMPHLAERPPIGRGSVEYTIILMPRILWRYVQGTTPNVCKGITLKGIPPNWKYSVDVSHFRHGTYRTKWYDVPDDGIIVVGTGCYPFRWGSDITLKYGDWGHTNPLTHLLVYCPKRKIKRNKTILSAHKN